MDIMLINNCINSGLGTIEEIQRTIKKNGKKWVQELLRFRQIAHENNR